MFKINLLLKLSYLPLACSLVACTHKSIPDDKGLFALHNANYIVNVADKSYFLNFDYENVLKDIALFLHERQDNYQTPTISLDSTDSKSPIFAKIFANYHVNASDKDLDTFDGFELSFIENPNKTELLVILSNEYESINRLYQKDSSMTYAISTFNIDKSNHVQ